MNDYGTWEEVPKELKFVILRFWFSYFTTIAITEEDINKFEKLIENEYDKVFDLIVSLAMTINLIDAKGLILCLRQNLEKELLENVLDESLFEGRKKIAYENTRKVVLSKIVETYLITAILDQEFNSLDNEDDDENTKGRTK